MKRVKFMLIAISLVTVVGGVFAFKASKMYTHNEIMNLCTTIPLNGTCGTVNPSVRTTCEIFEENARYTNDPLRPFICTTTPNAGGDIEDKCKDSNGEYKLCTTVASTKITYEQSKY